MSTSNMDHKTNVYRKTKGAKIMLTHHVTKEESPNNLPDSVKSKITSWLIRMGQRFHMISILFLV